MASVVFACPMGPEARAILEAKDRGTFDAVILEDLTADRREAAWAGADAAVIVGFARELPSDLAAHAPKLRMLQTLVAGVDYLPYRDLPPSLVVCGNAGAYNVSVGEHTMALLLAAAKDIPRRTEEIRAGVFDQSVMNKALDGATVLVLGMGGIGSFVARACKVFSMHVIGVSRTGRLVPPADESGRLADLPRLLPRADFIVVALPLTKATASLVDRTFLGRMKEDAVLVNVARGKLIVEDDLFEHLRAHPACRAALDVWWTYPSGKEGRPFHRPFHDLPNVVMTPHNANAIPVQRRRSMEAALDNVLRFVRGEPPRNVIDVTEYEPPALRDRN